MSNKASTTTPFLDQLDAATKVDDVGVYIIEDFLSQEEAKESFEILNNSTNLPWKANPTLYRIKLNQHAYEFRRSKRNIKRASKSIGMSKLRNYRGRLRKNSMERLAMFGVIDCIQNIMYHIIQVSLRRVFMCCFMCESMCSISMAHLY